MDKDTIKKYDEIVEHWKLNTKILTNYSKFWKSTRFQSDTWFDAKEQFLLKNLMRQNTELTFGEMRRWSFDDHKRHYAERAMGSDGKVIESFAIDTNNNTVRTELSSASEECVEAFLYRWNNGYAFMDVQERVDLALTRLLSEQGAVVRKGLVVMQRAEAAREEVRGALLDAAEKVSAHVSVSKLRNLAESLGLSDFIETEEDN